MLRDRDIQRDMDRLRQHLNNMTAQAEETLKTMEQLRDRLREQDRQSQTQ